MTMRETMDDIDEEELRSLKAGSMPAAYDDPGAPEMPLPGDDVDAPEPAGEMVLPEMDFRSEVQTQPTGNSGPTAFREPAAPSPAQDANDEYTAALRKIRDHLAKPAPDYSKGYAQARSKDVGENRISRIMDFINAAQRRAGTPNASPLATNAAGFLQKSQLERAQSDGELARLGKVAQLARPPAPPKGSTMTPYQERQIALREAEAKRKTEEGEAAKGSLEALKGYAYKHLPMLKEGDLDGLSEKAVESVLQEAGQLERAKIHAAAVAKARDDKPLAPTAIEAIADFDVADRALAQLETDFNDLGMSGLGAKVSGKATETFGLTGTDAAVYLNKAKQAQQVVGKILEGGKLAAGDERKYQGLIPQPGDSQQLLRSKVSGLRQFLGDMKSGRIQLYREGGYRVPGGGSAPPAPAPAPRTQETKTVNGVTYTRNADGLWETDG